MSINSVSQIPAGATTVSTESTVFTTAGLSVGAGVPAGVTMWGWITVTLGTGATGFQVRVRENTTGLGNQIDQTVSLTGLAAGNTYQACFVCNDSSPSFDDSGHAQYNVTVQQTGAPSAAGNVTGGDIVIEV